MGYASGNPYAGGQTYNSMGRRSNMNGWVVVIFLVLVAIVAGGGFMASSGQHLQDQLNQATVQKDKALKELADTQTVLAKTIEERDGLKAQIGALEHQNTAMKEQISVQETQIKETMAKIQTLTQNNKELNDGLQSLLEQNKVLVDSNNQMNQMIEADRQQLDDANKNVAVLEERIASLTAAAEKYAQQSKSSLPLLESTIGILMFASVPVSGAILVINNKRRAVKKDLVTLQLDRAAMHKYVQYQRSMPRLEGKKA
jgi:cell division protein FtsB